MTIRVYIIAKLAALAELVCFKAWNYAKRREHERRQWRPTSQAVQRDWNDDQRRIRGNEAAQVLDNVHFKEAWESLNDSLDSSILACDVYAKDGEQTAMRLVMAKQQLFGLRREFIRKIEDGIMSEVRIGQQRQPLQRVFRR